MANFATAVPFSRNQLARDVRQYQYYPNYNYQQYGNGYPTYPQYGEYQYDGQNGQSIQNQHEIYDICDDRSMNFEDKNIMQMLKHILKGNPLNGNLFNGNPPGIICAGQFCPGSPNFWNGPQSGSIQPANGRPPNGRPRNGLGNFLDLIRMIIRTFFGDKSYGGGIINKSTGQTATCHEVKSFVESEYRKFQQNPQGYASQIQGYQGQNTGYPNYGQPYGTYTGYNQGYTQNVYQGYPYYGPYQQYGR